MLTYCGVHVTREFGAPTVRDIAVQAMRIPRFCGSPEQWWPVGMHLLLVADLLPRELEHHGLLHDAAEVATNDIPRPMKTKGQRAVEHRVLRRIYRDLGVPFPTDEEEALVKRADKLAVDVEGVTLAGPRGFRDTQPNLTEDGKAMARQCEYLNGWNVLDAIDANGKWPRLLESRLRVAITRFQRTLTSDKAYGYRK